MSAAVYSGLTAMPSGVCQASASAPPGVPLATVRCQSSTVAGGGVAGVAGSESARRYLAWSE